MMKKNLILVILLVTSSRVFPQFYKTYDWHANPEIHALTKDEQKESSIGILKKHIVEYRVGIFSDLTSYETTHTITHVNDERGVDRHNTVYIPMYGVKNLVDIKARTINEEGEVTLFDRSQIKEINNVEEYGDFKIFAIEGAGNNSEIELLYTVEKEYDMHGFQTLQADYPIKNAEFVFMTGELNSKVKAYNTAEQFTKIDLETGTAKQLKLYDIPAMAEETYSASDANKVMVTFQCYPKGQNITQDMFWNNVVNNVGGQFFTEEANALVRADIPNVRKDYKDLNTFKMVTLLDEYIKTNFNIVRNNDPSLSDLDQILKNRNSSEFGILKAYAHYLKAFNIEFEVVITANRYTHRFDPDFFNPNSLREFLIYIPSEKKYIAPNRIEYRLGEAPPNILGNYGLFITESFEYYFSKITQTDPAFSRTKRLIDISFDENIESVIVEQTHEYTGHWSALYRAVMNLSSDENKKDFKENVTASGIEDKQILLYETENDDLMQLEYNKPYIIKANFSSEALLEEAGDSYIFQIGKVIGTQSELYQERERVNPIEMDYPNQYDYTITVNIPEGYAVEGLESLILDKSYQSVRGDKLCKFESNYELEDDKIVISIQEFYKSNEYDLARYEEFRQVINAASDFNKASILLKAIE
jgi:hypothetical protein